MGATDSMGGAVWALLADGETGLVAACDDGSARLFATHSDEADESAPPLCYTGVVRVATGARCLCLCWAELQGQRALFGGDFS